MFDDSEISWHVALTDLVLNDSNYSLTYANFTHFSAEREKKRNREEGVDYIIMWDVISSVLEKHTHTK